MTEVYGIEELKKVIKIFATIGTVAGKSLQDGVISITDLIYVKDFAAIFPDLIEINWFKIIPEVKDLSLEEAISLIDAFKEAFSLPMQGIETTIEAVLTWITEGISFIIKLIKTY